MRDLPLLAGGISYPQSNGEPHSPHLYIDTKKNPPCESLRYPFARRENSPRETPWKRNDARAHAREYARNEDGYNARREEQNQEICAAGVARARHTYTLAHDASRARVRMQAAADISNAGCQMDRQKRSDAKWDYCAARAKAN